MLREHVEFLTPNIGAERSNDSKKMVLRVFYTVLQLVRSFYSLSYSRGNTTYSYIQVS